MRRLTYPLVIWWLFANILNVSCDGTTSLTFVIDNTNSMYDDIDQVKKSADKITDIVFNEKSSIIKNMVLVTVNDPELHLEIVTQNRYAFQQKVQSIYLHNEMNMDCPEPSMQGLIIALENSLPGSYIYVFTDASAKDYPKSEQVKQLCQIKQSQIVFVLTGTCYGQNDPGFKAFYDVADSCSGLAFYVQKNEVDLVLNTIEENIRGNKTVVKSVTVNSGYKYVYFTIDDLVEHAIVSASGSNVFLEIHGPYAHKQHIMNTANGKVIKMTNITPGQYYCHVGGSTSTTVVIVGRTDFLFTHGFSELEPKSPADTSSQPIANANVYLSVSITDKKQLVRITTAQILAKDETLIRELPLREISKDFYITSPFVAPSQAFKVAVNGVIIATGKPIKRIAKIPVTPQEPPRDRPNNMIPVANIEEGYSISVEYNSVFKLTCKVKGYPKPEIKWTNNKGATVKSSSAVLQHPYEYISYLEISYITRDDKFTCLAANTVGQDIKNINVIVQEPLKVTSVPAEKTNVVYGKEGIITCDIKSSMPMRIRWYHTAENNNKAREIEKTDSFLTISPDGTKLKIKKMDFPLIGKFTCKATLINHEDIQKTFETQVKVIGLLAPKIRGVSVKKAFKGKAAAVECKLIQGVPKPTFSWQFMEKSGSKFISIGGSDNVLQIPSVEEKHEGRYRCEAKNVIGSTDYVTTLIVQDPPKINKNPSTLYETKEGDSHLKIPCVATGIPKPVITWRLKGHVITQSAKYSLEDGALVIREPKVADGGLYTCEAKNEVDTVSSTFQAYVVKAPNVTGVAKMTVKFGSSVTIECTVTGEPKSSIDWKFIDNNSKVTPLAGSYNKLHLTNVKEQHAGQYKCLAKNKLGSAEHVTTLIVEFAPRIRTKQSEIHDSLVGDVAMRIPCEVVGIPKPVVSWKVNGVAIKANAKYLIEDGALVIVKPNIKDTATYKCEATNSMGSASATFQGKVKQHMDSFGKTQNIYLLQGENGKIPCGAYNKSEPSQSVRWFIEDVDMKMNEPNFLVEKASVDQDGNYTCHVSDRHGHTQTLTYVVNVGYPPKLYESTPINDWNGDINEINSNCASEAKPHASVEWIVNGKVLTNLSSVEANKYFTWGHYTCNVSNPLGWVQRSFDVNSSDCLLNRNLEESKNMPLIITNDHAWPLWESTEQNIIVKQNEKFIMSCPNNKNAANSFQKFPNQNELYVVCDKQDTFQVNDKIYKLSDLQCSDSIYPSLVGDGLKCLTEFTTGNSESIRVGYYVDGFLETYDVCFDHAVNMPLFSRVLMSPTAGSQSTTFKWHKYDVIGVGKASKDVGGLTCVNSTSSCCYGKTQLVSAEDFNYGAAKTSTFIEPLNAVPYWRPCNSKKISWEDIDVMVRSQLTIYDQFVSWSGTHTMQKKDQAFIPRYLWKVVRFSDDDAVAIVHVNDPSPTANDIKCKNIDDEVNWFKSNDAYTYCCDLTDFLKAFGLGSTDVGESLEAAIKKITRRKPT